MADFAPRQKLAGSGDRENFGNTAKAWQASQERFSQIKAAKVNTQQTPAGHGYGQAALRQGELVTAGAW